VHFRASCLNFPALCGRKSGGRQCSTRGCSSTQPKRPAENKPAQAKKRKNKSSFRGKNPDKNVQGFLLSGKMNRLTRRPGGSGAFKIPLKTTEPLPGPSKVPISNSQPSQSISDVNENPTENQETCLYDDDGSFDQHLHQMQMEDQLVPKENAKTSRKRLSENQLGQIDPKRAKLNLDINVTSPEGCSQDSELEARGASFGSVLMPRKAKANVDYTEAARESEEEDISSEDGDSSVHEWEDGDSSSSGDESETGIAEDLAKPKNRKKTQPPSGDVVPKRKRAARKRKYVEGEDDLEETEENPRELAAKNWGGHFLENETARPVPQDITEFLEERAQRKAEKQQLCKTRKLVPVDQLKFVRGAGSRKEGLKSSELRIPTEFRGCHPSCRLDCGTKFSQETREGLFKQYHTSEISLRHQLMLAWCKRYVTELRRSNSKKRPENPVPFVHYHLPSMEGDKQELVRVCKNFFNGTFGWTKSNDTAQKWIQKVEKFQSVNDRRNRGPGVSSHDTATWARRKEEIFQHILTYHPVQSHYRRENCPNAYFVSSEVTQLDMLNNFNESRTEDEKVSRSTYMRVMKAMNVHIGNGKTNAPDCCEICQENTEHKKQTAQSIVHESIDCQPCRDWAAHHARKVIARKFYENDRDHPQPNTVYVSADLMKVILLPYLRKYKAAAFTPRLVTYLEAYTPLGNAAGLLNYISVWHEAISGRRCWNLASSFYAFLIAVSVTYSDHEGSITLVIWLDNCTSQNKNWTLFAWLLHWVNKLKNIRKIILKFLEIGHSHMSADSTHGVVERLLRRAEQVHDFNHFIRTCQKASVKYTVEPLEYHDHYKLPNLTKTPKPVTFPKLREMKRVMFVKGSYKLHYSNSMEGEFETANILSTTQFPDMEALRQPEARGMNDKKKQKIVENLGDLLPADSKDWWSNLKSSETIRDLLTRDKDPADNVNHNSDTEEE